MEGQFEVKMEKVHMETPYMDTKSRFITIPQRPMLSIPSKPFSRVKRYYTSSGPFLSAPSSSSPSSTASSPASSPKAFRSSWNGPSSPSSPSRHADGPTQGKPTTQDSPGAAEAQRPIRNPGCHSSSEALVPSLPPRGYLPGGTSELVTPTTHVSNQLTNHATSHATNHVPAAHHAPHVDAVGPGDETDKPFLVDSSAPNSTKLPPETAKFFNGKDDKMGNASSQDEEAYYAFKLREEYKRSFVPPAVDDKESPQVAASVGKKIRHHLKLTPFGSCSGIGPPTNYEEEKLPFSRDVAKDDVVSDAKKDDRRSRTLPLEGVAPPAQGRRSSHEDSPVPRSNSISYCSTETNSEIEDDYPLPPPPPPPSALSIASTSLPLPPPPLTPTGHSLTDSPSPEPPPDASPDASPESSTSLDFPPPPDLEDLQDFDTQRSPRVVTLFREGSYLSMRPKIPRQGFNGSYHRSTIDSAPTTSFVAAAKSADGPTDELKPLPPSSPPTLPAPPLPTAPIPVPSALPTPSDLDNILEISPPSSHYSTATVVSVSQSPFDKPPTLPSTTPPFDKPPTPPALRGERAKIERTSSLRRLSSSGSSDSEGLRVTSRPVENKVTVQKAIPIQLAHPFSQDGKRPVPTSSDERQILKKQISNEEIRRVSQHKVCFAGKKGDSGKVVAEIPPINITKLEIKAEPEPKLCGPGAKSVWAKDYQITDLDADLKSAPPLDPCPKTLPPSPPVSGPVSPAPPSPTYPAPDTPPAPRKTMGLHRRQKSCEELEYDEKASELALRLHDKEKILKVVIAPHNEKRSVQDYVSGVLDFSDIPTPEPPMDFDFTPSPDPQNSEKGLITPPNENSLTVIKLNNKRASISPLIPPLYYTTPEDTLKNLEKLTEEQEELLKRLEYDEKDEKLDNQKEELLASINRKLESLRTSEAKVLEQIRSNDGLHHKFVRDLEDNSDVKKQDLEKYRNYVDDLSRVVHTILLLAGRLAKAENARANSKLESEAAILERRCTALRRQNEEATELKESIDKRGKKVRKCLTTHLDDTQMTAFDRFVAHKSKLPLLKHELSDKVLEAETQCAALVENLRISEMARQRRQRQAEGGAALDQSQFSTDSPLSNDALIASMLAACETAGYSDL